jgi:pimeloyl-ACP methyl ester carboxylesterase
VHFHDLGDGPPVVLLHQAPMCAHQFDAVMPLLAGAGLRAIAIDLPGFGGSDAPSAPPTIAHYAAIVPCVLDHLGLAQADLLGHHTGALVATEVALAFPERVRRLILNGPVPMTPEERAAGLEDVARREKTYRVRPDGSHLQAAFEGRFAYVAGSVSAERVNDYVLWMVSGDGPFWYGHNAAFTYDHADRLAFIRHPTLILTNTGDAIYDLAQRAQTLRPDFAFVALEGGGIDVQDQLPQAWAAAVTDFLRLDEG